MVFVNSIELGKLGSSLPSSPSLTKFTNFQVFYPISHGISELTRKIV
jgi:hypothetical protein